MDCLVEILRLSNSERKGLPISYSFYPTEFGMSLIASTHKGICYIGFGSETAMLEDFKKRYPQAHLTHAKNEMHQQALRFICTGKTDKRMILHLYGTDFQIAVWNALLQIPYGSLTSYSKVAERAGNPKAVRATGSAIGANPVSYIIPCHRVIRSDGGRGGYFWGLETKETMINKEHKL